MDNAYSIAVDNALDALHKTRYKDREPNPLESLLSTAVHYGSSPVTYLGAKSAGPGYMDRNMAQRLVEPVMGTGKYIIPAAGVTAAGIGIHDLVQLIREQQSLGVVEP